MGKYFLIPLLLWAQLINTGPTRKVFSGTPAPMIRCSASTSTGAGSASTINVPFCGSAIAGDFTVIFVNSAFNLSAAAGWTTVLLNGGGVWSMYVATKALSSGDISTGFVTVNAAGSFDMPAASVTFVGATSGVREFQFFYDASPHTLTSTSAVQHSDVGLYYASVRGATTPTITPGSGSVTTLQTITTTGSGTHSLLVDQQPAGGVQGNVYASLGAANGTIQVFVMP